MLFKLCSYFIIQLTKCTLYKFFFFLNRKNVILSLRREKIKRAYFPRHGVWVCQVCLLSFSLWKWQVLWSYMGVRFQKRFWLPPCLLNCYVLCTLTWSIMASTSIMKRMLFLFFFFFGVENMLFPLSTSIILNFPVCHSLTFWLFVWYIQVDPIKPNIVYTQQQVLYTPLSDLYTPHCSPSLPKSLS